MPRRSYRVSVRGKVWLEAGQRFAVGDGGVRLLAAIDQTGSIRAGAQRVGWSYRHALASLRNAEIRLGQQLVARMRGGNERGAARLTDAERDLAGRYERLRQRLDTALQQMNASILADWS
jgi:molybdate transport system regulatory protein